MKLQIIDNEHVTDYFETLERLADGSPITEVFWQLEDFDFDCIVVLEGDVTLEDGEDLFSEDFLTSQVHSDEGPEGKWLVVIKGNVNAEGPISLSEDYGLVFGDVRCKSLYVDGEALWGCTGTCTAESIWSSYNGVSSCIRRAVADYVVLSNDEMLSIKEAGCDLLCLDEGISALHDAGVLVPEVANAKKRLQAFLDRLRNDGSPFNDGVTLKQLHRDLADTALIRRGEAVARKG